MPEIKPNTEQSQKSHASTVDNSANLLEPKQRYQMIAEAAYFRAEARGFGDGDPVRDWVEAEKEIETLFH